MSYLPLFDYNTASEQAKKVYDEHRRPMNKMKLTLLNSVPAFKAVMGWYELYDEAQKFITELDVNLFCYAISFENDCMVCSSYFRKFLSDNGVDFHGMVFTPVQQVLVNFARNVADNPHEVDETQIEELREFFDDEQLVVIVSLAAMMIANNTINTVLDVDL